MSDILWKLLATFGLVVLNGYFVAAEFAAVGARQSRLETKAEAGSFLARAALKVKTKLDLYLSTCQLGITVASLGLGVMCEPVIAAMLEPVLAWFGLHAPPDGYHVIAITVALLIATTLHVVVGEVAPKNLAIFYPDRILPVLALPLIALTYVLYPFIWSLNTASNLLLRAVGVKLSHGAHGGMPHSEDELRGLVRQAAASGQIEKGQSNILMGAFNFNTLLTRQIMTPRTSLQVLNVNDSVTDVLNKMRRSQYTRLPLCDGDIDHVIGMVHVKDVLNHLRLIPDAPELPHTDAPELPHTSGFGAIDLLKIKRDVLHVPELVPLPLLLKQFQETQLHLAVVVDEYGHTQGIVTMEDVLEEIVGEIDDEFDTAARDYVIEGDTLRVNGTFALHELRQRIKLPQAVENATVDTLGGYIAEMLGRMPRVGDVVQLGEYDARVLTAPARRVGAVRLTKRVNVDTDTTTPASNLAPPSEPQSAPQSEP